MRQYFFSSLIFFLGYAVVHSQSASDSLKRRVANYPKQDTVLVELLVDYCVSRTFDVNDEMLAYAKRSLDLSKKLKYANGEIRSLNNIGNYYYQVSIYDKAAEFYNRALNRSIQQNSPNNIIISKSNLASLFIRTGETPKAIRLLLECDSILLSRNDSLIQNRAALLVNIGGAYSAAGNHDQAIDAYLKAYGICHKLQIAFGMALSLSNTASEYVFKKEYANAIAYLNKAEDIVLKSGNSFFLAQIYMNKGLSYCGLKNDQLGITYLQKSIEFCVQSDDKQTLVNVYRNIHPIYLRNNLKDEAYQYLLKYTALNDSIVGENKQKSIDELHVKYDTQRKEFSIHQLEQENQIVQLQSQRKSMLIYSIIFIVCLVLLVLYFLFARFKTKKRHELLIQRLADAERLRETEYKASQSEIKAIKSQMNPHFFYNALNSIQGFVYAGEKEKAAESIGLFSDLSRAVLESSRSNEISLYEEVKLLDHYLRLECMRLPKISYTITCPQDLPSHDIYLPSMILQPLVENAVKHGLANKSGKGHIQVSFDVKDQRLLIRIDDDGIGRNAAEALNQRVQRKGASFSTEANINRIELLNENKSEKISQQIIDKVDDIGCAIGTLVKLSIPLIQHD